MSKKINAFKEKNMHKPQPTHYTRYKNGHEILLDDMDQKEKKNLVARTNFIST